MAGEFSGIRFAELQLPEHQHQRRDDKVFRMRRYYFHVKRGQLTVLDHEGVELADIIEAEREATCRAEAIVLREGLNAPPQGTGVIVIVDDWQAVMEVPF
jgi:hypothetical protein